MTRYERGFLTKCAEHGIDVQSLVKSGVSFGGIVDAVKSIPRYVRRYGQLMAGGESSKVKELSDILKTVKTMERNLADDAIRNRKTLNVMPIHDRGGQIMSELKDLARKRLNPGTGKKFEFEFGGKNVSGMFTNPEMAGELAKVDKARAITAGVGAGSGGSALVTIPILNSKTNKNKKR